MHDTSPKPVWSNTDLADDPHTAADKPDRIRRMFGAIAPSYDLNNRVHSFGLDQAWRRRVVKLTRPGSGDDVLDVACGTGDLTEAFAEAGVASVTGLDCTQEMLDLAGVKANRRSRRTGTPAPTYRLGDAMDLPFEDGSFDIVSIAFGIRNVSEPAQAVREMTRVLRPGGRLAILEFAEPRLAPVRWANRLYTHTIMPWTATLLARDRSGAYRYLPRSIETFLTPEQLRAELEAAGLTVEHQQRLTLGICVATIAHRS